MKTLPQQGLAKQDIVNSLEAFGTTDANWKRGRTFSLVFYPGEEATNILKHAYNRYFFENGLNPAAFKSLNRMENEVVSMTAALLNAPDTGAGSMTSGGTESIICAVKAAKKYALAKNPGNTKPNLVAPETIHPAFFKAADYLEIEMRLAKGKGESLLPDVNDMRALVDSNTILIAGSAPAYPHGIIDPLKEISDLALEKGIWMHVDACVGGYLIPFLEQAGEQVPVFDFRLPGVWSISLDLHKYGYSAKGASVVLYRNSDLRKNQYYAYTAWPGGFYVSPSVSGTRPGGAIAAAWSILHYLGKDGYINMARQTLKAAHKIQTAVNTVAGLKVVGNPLLPVFSFTSTGSIDIYHLGDELSARGWHLDRQITPPSLHLTVSYGNVAFVDDFINDLNESVAKLKANSVENIGDKLLQGAVKTAAQILPEKWIKKMASGSIQNASQSASGKTAPLYGLAGELSGSNTLDEMLVDLLDAMNKPE
jgi:glutamate/tyrosine decarboxylase-like PLP-dependent enzyme